MITADISDLNELPGYVQDGTTVCVPPGTYPATRAEVDRSGHACKLRNLQGFTLVLDGCRFEQQDDDRYGLNLLALFDCSHYQIIGKPTFDGQGLGQNEQTHAVQLVDSPHGFIEGIRAERMRGDAIKLVSYRDAEGLRIGEVVSRGGGRNGITFHSGYHKTVVDRVDCEDLRDQAVDLEPPQPHLYPRDVTIHWVEFYSSVAKTAVTISRSHGFKLNGGRLRGGYVHGVTANNATLRNVTTEATGPATSGSARPGLHLQRRWHNISAIDCSFESSPASDGSYGPAALLGWSHSFPEYEARAQFTNCELRGRYGVQATEGCESLVFDHCRAVLLGERDNSRGFSVTNKPDRPGEIVTLTNCESNHESGLFVRHCPVTLADPAWEVTAI